MCSAVVISKRREGARYRCRGFSYVGEPPQYVYQLPGDFEGTIQYSVVSFRDSDGSKQIVEGRLHTRIIISLVKASLILCEVSIRHVQFASHLQGSGHEGSRAVSLGVPTAE
jgi:hypothetical protein